MLPTDYPNSIRFSDLKINEFGKLKLKGKELEGSLIDF